MDSISLDLFNTCVRDMVAVSDTLLDGWILHEHQVRLVYTRILDTIYLSFYSLQDKENGIFVVKKHILNLSSDNNYELDSTLNFEYHIAYSISYGVPVLCFNVWRRSKLTISH